MESKKLLTKIVVYQSSGRRAIRGSGAHISHDARIAHSLMDPSRKTPETPLEKEQREVIRQLWDRLNREHAGQGYKPCSLESPDCSAHIAAMPFLEA